MYKFNGIEIEYKDNQELAEVILSTGNYLAMDEDYLVEFLDNPEDWKGIYEIEGMGGSTIVKIDNTKNITIEFE